VQEISRHGKAVGKEAGGSARKLEQAGRSGERSVNSVFESLYRGHGAKDHEEGEFFAGMRRMPDDGLLKQMMFGIMGGRPRRRWDR